MMSNENSSSGFNKNQVISGNGKSYKFWKTWSKKRLLIIAGIVIVLIGAGTGGYLLIAKFTNTAKDGSTAQKVLSIKDLENPDVELTAATTDASVENLTSGLKAKIDAQIAAKENPIGTVKKLASMLFNTTNEKRQDQLANFLEDFLVNHEDALWFKYEYDMPDQAQVNYWKAELYTYLIYNFQTLMEDKFATAEGRPIDTTQEQLKYIDLYLALANDSASHPPIPEQYKDILVGYVYKEASNFSELKNSLTEVGAAQ